MAPKPPEEYRMSLGDHLDELRYRLMIGLAGPFVAMVAMFAVADRVIIFLCQPLYAELREHNLPPILYTPSVMSAFSIWVRVSMIGGLIIGLPWLLWHLWSFVAPGLYPKERRYVTRLIPATSLFAFSGVAFMYYALLPKMLHFLIVFSLTFGGTTPERPTDVQPLPPGVVLSTMPVLSADPKDPAEGQTWVKVPENQLRVMIGGKMLSTNLTIQSAIVPLVQVEEYIKMVLFLALGFTLAFQVPLVMLALAWSGIVSRKQMASVRRYMILVNTILGAVLTGGADPISMITLAVALQVLYEVGLLLILWKVKPSPEIGNETIVGGDNDTGP